MMPGGAWLARPYCRFTLLTLSPTLIQLPFARYHTSPFSSSFSRSFHERTIPSDRVFLSLLFSFSSVLPLFAPARQVSSLSLCRKLYVKHFSVCPIAYIVFTGFRVNRNINRNLSYIKNNM